MNVGTLTILLGVTTSGINKTIRDVNRLERTVATSAGSMNAALLSFGRVMTQFGTFPLTVLGATAIKTFSDFEANLAKVTGLVGIASEQTAAWGEEIKALSPAVAKGPKELAEALYFVTTGGIRGAETMDVLNVSAKAAAAGLGETKTVADLIVSAMNAYGKENLNAARAGDILVATVKEAKVEAAGFAQSMGIVFPMAAQLGVSLEQVGVAMAGMTRTGTKAATAAMQTRMILTKIINPAQGSEKAIKAVGLSFEGLRHSLKEKGLLSTLVMLNDKTKEFGIETMAKIFPNIRALAGILDLVGNNLDQTTKSEEAIINSTGALNHAFETVSKTWKFQLNQTIKQGQIVLLEWGEAVSKVLIPMIKNLLETFSGWVKSFNELSEAQQKFRVAVGLLVAAMGPLMIIFSVLRASVLPVLVRLYFGLEKAMKVFLTTNTAVIANVKKQIAATNIHIATTEAHTQAIVRNRMALVAQAATTNNALNLMRQKVVFDGMFVASTGKSMLATKKLSTALLTQNLTMVKVTSTGMALSSVFSTMWTKIVSVTKAIGMMIARSAMVAGFVAIIAIVVTALIGWARGIKKTYDAQEELNKAHENATRAILTEKAALDSLLATAVSEYSSKDMRAQAIKRLNDLSPEYLRNLTEENAQTEKGKKLIDDYTKSIEARNKQTAIANQMAELQKKRIDDIATGQDRQLDFWERARKGGVVYAATLMDVTKGLFRMNTPGKIAAAVTREIGWENEKAARTAKEFEEAMNALNEELLRSQSSLQDYAIQYQYLAEQVEKAKDLDKDNARQVIAGIDAQNKALENHLKILNEVIATKAAGSWIDFMASDEGAGLIDLKGALEKEIKNAESLKELIKSFYDDLFDMEEYKKSAGYQLQELWSEYLDELTKVEARHKRLGGDYDVIGEKLKLINSILDKTDSIEGALNAKWVQDLTIQKAKWEGVTDAIQKFKDEISEIQKTAASVEFTDPQWTELDEVLYSTNVAMARVNIQSINMGESYDRLGGIADVLKQKLESLQKIAATRLLNADEIKEYLKTLKQLSEWNMESIKLEMEGDLKQAAEQAAVLGETFKENEAKIRIYKNTLNRLLNVSSEAWEDMSQEYRQSWANMIDEMINKIGELEKKQKSFERVMGYISQLLSEFTSLSKVLIDKQIDDLKRKYDYEIEMAGNNTRKKTQLEEEYNKKRIALLRKQAIIEKALGIFSVVINTAKGAADAASKVATLPLVPWIIALGAAQAAVIAAQPIPMKEGGIVPQGYNNDTYPAMLSSGEMVIPPHKLPDFERQPMEIKMNGDWRIKGRDLYYVMSEEERRVSNVY